MSVTRQDIEKIAALAELGVDDVSAAELQRQLTRILDYVAQLSEVTDDATSVEDERAARLRRDVVNPDPLSRTPREIAPAFTDGLFTVPRRTPAEERTTPPMRRPPDPTHPASPPRLGELDRGDDAP
jgi:aspartyl-tRNA(Asn)/glutamyl-tRNA(Gln) amidotransferase subunit C